MKLKIQIILISLLVLTSILFIRSTSIFALPDENCYCHDWAEAWETCDMHCGFGGETCILAALYSTKGVCNDRTYCQIMWRLWCSDWSCVYYWQYTWCSQDCWLWVNQFWKTNHLEDIFPSFLVKAIKTLWVG